MKLTSNGGSKLSLNKTTVSILDKAQISQLKGGQKTTDGGGIPQTCGYACGDCMSTMQSLVTCVPNRPQQL